MIKTGNFITIDYLNEYYEHLAEMCLEYYDTPEYRNSVMILGTNVKVPLHEIKQKHDDQKEFIIYQTEQLFGGSAFTWHSVDKIINNFDDVDQLWDFDPINILYLKKFRNIAVSKFYPLRYTCKLDSELYKSDYNPIDVLFTGTVNERRFNWIYKTLQYGFQNNLKIMTLIGVTGDYLKDCIRKSKIILNIHPFEPFNRQEQVRMFYPIINGKCVISEPSQCNCLGESVIEVERENIVSLIEDLLKNNKYKSIGINARNKFIENTTDENRYDNYRKNLLKMYEE